VLRRHSARFFVKRLKRIALFVLMGFLAFAPPGTLIVAGVVLSAFLGSAWYVVAAAAVLVVAALVLLLRRRRGKRRQPFAARSPEDDAEGRRG
jgi:membrane protein implicated in regulation of membrane protease activity